MELKSGYKQSEVGIIPEDWEVVLLDSIAKRGSGHTPSKQYPAYWDGDIKWVSLADSSALDNLYIEDTAAKITPLGIANSSAVLHPAGTVILSRDAGVGKSAIIKSEMAVSQHFMAWQCGQSLDGTYLYYWLQSEKQEFERIANGSTIKTIGLAYFRELKIPLPSISEQRAIATTLNDVSALIGALDAQIAKKRDLKIAAMQRLLTGFSGEWKKVTLKEMGVIYGGMSGKTKADFDTGTSRYIPFLNVMNNVIINPRNILSVDVKENESQNKVRKGDLFFNGSSETPDELGMCAVLEDDLENTYLNSFCFGFKLHDQKSASNLFLAYVFRFGEGRQLLYALAQGATRYNLSKANFLKLRISLPKVEEQVAIAEVLSDMDAEIAALEAKRDKTRDLKRGMMQELLTGRTRLIPTNSNSLT